MQNDYDILIIGGGMVGASLAVALRDIPLRVGIVEAVPFASSEQPSYDVRAIALSQGSKRIFETIGVWPAMVELGVTAIENIHVSDRGHFGTARLHAGEEGVEALGYVAEAGVIGKALATALNDLPHSELICPARLHDLSVEEHAVRVELEQEGVLRDYHCALVIAADGGRSTVRERIGGRTFRLGYGQTAVIANVVTDREHGKLAYERFTDSGPMALLPNDAPAGSPESVDNGHRWSLVWTARDGDVEKLLGLNDALFLLALQKRFGRRAGRFLKASPRSAYPLGLQYVRDYVQPRVTFIGNAAHTIHPVGGQGFNLGLRDVAVLADVLADAAVAGADVGSHEVLDRYNQWRRTDYLKTIGMTDGLARTFSNNFTPLVVARDMGIMALDLFPSLKHGFARQFMGFAGRMPRLARGQALGMTNGTDGATGS